MEHSDELSTTNDASQSNAQQDTAPGTNETPTYDTPLETVSSTPDVEAASVAETAAESVEAVSPAEAVETFAAEAAPAVETAAEAFPAEAAETFAAEAAPAVEAVGAFSAEAAPAVETFAAEAVQTEPLAETAEAFAAETAPIAETAETFAAEAAPAVEAAAEAFPAEATEAFAAETAPIAETAAETAEAFAAEAAPAVEAAAEAFPAEATEAFPAEAGTFPAAEAAPAGDAAFDANAATDQFGEPAPNADLMMNGTQEISDVAATPAAVIDPAQDRKKKTRILIIIIAIVVVAIIVGVFAFRNFQSTTYEHAFEAYAAGDYELAADEFGRLGNYENAPELHEKCLLWVEAQTAENEAANGSDIDLWLAAAEAYDEIGDSEADKNAERCRGNADYYSGLALLEKSPTDRKTVTDALALFKNCTDISDAETQASYCENVLKYYEAEDFFAQGLFYEAYKAYNSVSTAAAAKLGNVAEKANSCIQPIPDTGVIWTNENYPDACELTIVNEGNPNAYYKLYFGDELIITVFIAANDRATFMLPAGVYSMNKAYGDTWFGPTDMFGDDGSYYKCNFAGSETFELEANNGYEISTGGTGTGIGSQSARRDSI